MGNCGRITKRGAGNRPFLLKGRLHMRRLTVQKGKKTVYSKPWDFEAMCLVDDCRSTANPVQMCTACVEYLFDGVLTTEQLHGFGGRKMYELCLTVVCWYRADVLKASASCNVSADGRMAAGKLRDVYRAIFQAWGRLPDEVGRQTPSALFLAIAGGSEQTEIPSNVSALYGI